MKLTKLTVLFFWWPPTPWRQFSLSFRRFPSHCKSHQLRKCLGSPSKPWTCVLSFQVLNILSSDSYSLFEAALFCPLPATIPILMAVCAVYAFFILGPTALIGISVYMLLIPIQVIAGLCSCISRTLSLKWVEGFASRAWPWNLSPYFRLMGSIVFKKLEFECPREGGLLLQFVRVSSASLVSWWFVHLYHLARLRLCPQRILTTTQWKDSAENLSLRTFPGTYTLVPGFLGQQQLSNSLWTLYLDFRCFWLSSIQLSDDQQFQWQTSAFRQWMSFWPASSWLKCMPGRNLLPTPSKVGWATAERTTHPVECAFSMGS